MIHGRAACEGYPCPIHAPSAHHMSDWPMFTRASRLIERVCPHGVGHPDPDSLGYFERVLSVDRVRFLRLGDHGCDGCCITPVVDIEVIPIPAAFLKAFE